MSGMSEEYKTALRDLMARKGRPIEWDERERELHPEWTQFHVSSYGWVDYKADDHCRPVNEYNKDGGCAWVVEPGVVLTEQTYGQFTDTDHDNADEVGINVGPVRCKCGKYTDITLRYVGSLGEVLQELFRTPDPTARGIEL